jgi:hypothetical protein
MAERDKLNATIKASIAGKELKLRLTIGDIEAVEEDLNTGLPVLLRKLQGREYQLRELRTVLERALRSAGDDRITRDDVRAMLTGANLPAALVAVQRAILAALDMGPTEADGEQGATS